MVLLDLRWYPLVLLVCLLAGGIGSATGLEPYEYATSWPAADGRLMFPGGIATAPNGDLYVTAFDSGTYHSSIERHAADGRLLSRIALPVNESWEASYPMDVAVNSTGYVYVTDAVGGPGRKGAVFVLSPEGVLVDYWQPWAAADTALVYGVGIGPDDHVFVTDYNIDTVSEFTAGGDLVVVYGGSHGTGPGQFSMPVDVAVAADGTCYVSNFVQGEWEETNERRGYITRFVPGGAWTGWVFDGDWALMTCLDDSGRLSVSNFVHYGPPAAPVRGVNADYAVYIYEADGTLHGVIGSRGEAAGQVERPMGVAAGRSGEVYVTENARGSVQMWRPYSSPPGPLSASFAAYPQSGIVPFAVRFLDYSTGASGWSWDFGDGTSSNEHAPAHTYQRSGRYTVSLTVDTAGVTKTETKYDYIVATGAAPTPIPAPVAESWANTTKGPAPLVVAFTDESTGSPCGWVWEFGDGATSSEQNPVHTYTAPGVYLVNLTVFAASGSGRTEYPVRIRVAPDSRAPVANFTLSRDSGTAPLYVRFTDTSAGAPTSWRWDFGGLAWTTATSPNVVFRRPGDYAVSLTVANAYGSSTLTRNLSVAGAISRGLSGPVVKIVG